MVDVMNKICERNGCNRQSSSGFENGRFRFSARHKQARARDARGVAAIVTARSASKTGQEDFVLSTKWKEW